MSKETYDKLLQCINESRLIGTEKVKLLKALKRSVAFSIENGIKLGLLEDGGVDNWTYYSDALKNYNKDREKTLIHILGTADTAF